MERSNKDLQVITLVRVQILPAKVPQVRSGPALTFDGRTCKQWLKSAIQYCNWRSGDAWRSLSSREQREAPQRWEYIDAVRVLTDALNAPDEPLTIHPALPLLNPAPAPLPHEATYRTWRRLELARHLVAEDPRYTDVSLLARLPKPKLARMLAESRQRSLAALRLSA